MAHIPDREINLLEGDDLLGTKVYADSLLKIIESKPNDRPLTIGLFGRWGTGKSSVVKTLTEKLSGKKDTKFHLYDAWKYSEDAFRRSFILSLKEGFGLASEKELDTFYQDKHEDVDHKIGIDKNWFVSLFFIVPLLLFLIWTTKYDVDLKTTISAIGVILSVICFLIKETFIKYKISISKPKVFSPEQFETVFKEIIEELSSEKRTSWKWIKSLFTKENKVKKIIIIIDNIDRCDKELAKELLLTIKNFLDHSNCIFIIPIDDFAIKRHLGFSNYEGEEFLRKFFNTTIRIKSFANEDLFDYTQALIQKYNLGFSNNVCSIIAQEFSRNPRRIIQFLNNLYSEKLVSEYQEEKGYIKKGLITNNIDFLAKVLLIKEEFPQVYSKIDHDILYVKKIDEAVNQFKVEIEPDFHLSPDEFSFFKRTQTITSNSVEPFIRLKFKQIPSEIHDLILNQDWEKLKTLISEEFTFQALRGILVKGLDLSIIRRKTAAVEGFSFLTVLFKISADSTYLSEFENYHIDFEPFIKDSNVKDILLKFNPDLVINYSKRLFIHKKLYLKESLLEQIASQNIPNAREFYISYVKTYLNDESLLRLKKSFSEVLEKDFERYEDYQEILNEQSSLQKLISNELIDSRINAVERNHVNAVIQRIISFLKHLNKNDVLNDEFLSHYIAKIAPYIDASAWIETTFWLGSLDGFVIKCHVNTAHITLFNQLEGIESNLREQFNTNPTGQVLECSMSFCKITYELLVVSLDYKIPLLNWLFSFFNLPQEQTLYLTINDSFAKIVKLERGDISFYETVLNKLQNISDWDNIQKLAGTLNSALKLEIGNFGTSVPLVKSTTNLYLRYLIDDENKAQKVIEWLKEIGENTLVLEQIKLSISELNTNDQIIYLKYIDRFNNSVYAGDVPKKLINSAKTIQEFDKHIDLIKTNLKDSAKYISEEIWGTIATSGNSDISYNHAIVEAFVKNQEIMPAENINQILNKLIKQAGDEVDPDGQLFALRMIAKFEKDSLSESQLDELNVFFRETNNDVVNNNSIYIKVKKKFHKEIKISNKESFEFKKQIPGDDHYYPKLLNFEKYKYIITVLPITDYWRLGLKLRKDALFKKERQQADTPLFHLTKDLDNESLRITFYPNQQTALTAEGDHKIIEKYSREPITFEIGVKNKAIQVTIKDQNGNELHNGPIISSDYKLCSLSTWGDLNDCQVNTTIERIPLHN
ncbi:MAG: P-loop NTPase fold protein [Bacteroidota bacterium]|nr:P-loop NTPase fold protein [Bacteroidota bacterium]